MRRWVEAATDAGVRQVREIFRILRRIRWPRDADRETIADTISRALDRTPTNESTKLTGDFLVATTLAGALNGQLITERRRGKIQAAEPDLGVFLRPFAEAIEALRNRVVLPSDVFQRLERQARQRAGRVAGMQNVRVVQTIYDRLLEVLEAGGGTSDFRAAVREIEGSREWGQNVHWHVRLVYQQNATMAFQTGQFRQASGVGSEVYIWRGRLDNCPICDRYVDKAFTKSDLTVYPGFAHFGCDCYAEHILPDENVGEVQRISAIENPDLDKARANPSQLQGSPAEFGNLIPLDLTNVPRGLRGKFRQFVGEQE